MFKKINSRYLLFAVVITFLFLGNNTASAIEVSLGLGANPTLGEYTSFLFTALIGIGVTLSFIFFVIGAIGLISPTPESHNDAKDRMIKSILGLILTLSSYIIITTINPKLAQLPTLTPLPEITTNAPELAGVYFYSNAGCDAKDNKITVGPYTGDMESLPSGIAAIKIVSDSSVLLDYGVILHKTDSLAKGGECGLPITQTGCHAIDVSSVGSMDIFIQNKNGSSGDGVDFYSRPQGWNSGAKAGYKTVEDSEISGGSQGYFEIPASAIKFEYTGYTISDVPDQYRKWCSTFNACPGSIGSTGSYLIALYSDNDYCQTFTDSIPNLKTEPITKYGGYVKYVYLIPTL